MKPQTRKYTIEVTTTENGTKIERTNEGFSVFELLGILQMVQKKLLEFFENGLDDFDEVNIKSTDSPIIHEENKSI